MEKEQPTGEIKKTSDQEPSSGNQVEEAMGKAKGAVSEKCGKLVETPPLVDKFSRMAELEWPVLCFEDKSLGKHELQCSMDPQTQRYHIMGNRRAFENPEETAADFLHECCHFRLAQKFGHLFVMATFTERLRKDQDFGAKVSIFRMVRALEDVWVDDEMRTLGEEGEQICDEAILHTAKLIERASPSPEWQTQFHQNPSNFSAFGLVFAQAHRYQIKEAAEIGKNLLEKFERNPLFASHVPSLQKMINVARNFPPISDCSQEEALGHYENRMRALSTKLKCNIVPSIVPAEGKNKQWFSHDWDIQWKISLESREKKSKSKKKEKNKRK